MNPIIKVVNTMGVQFDSGSFTATSGSGSTKLTEFALDRAVDVFIGLQVDENDGSFLLYLISPQTDGSVVMVQGSAPIDVSGISINVAFRAVPAGYYQIVVLTLGDPVNVSGSFSASWDNIIDGAVEESLPVRLPEEPLLLEIDALPQDPDAPVVQWMEVDTIAQGY
jgi:hypothetical protein